MRPLSPRAGGAHAALRAALLLAPLLVLGAPPAAAQGSDLGFLDEPPTYFIEELGTLAPGNDPTASSKALGIDAGGRVAGESAIAPGSRGPQHVFVHGGSMRDVGPDWIEATFHDFNARNWFVGRFKDETTVVTADFLLMDGGLLVEPVPLQPLQLTANLMATSQAGLVVGFGIFLPSDGSPGSRTRGYVWSPIDGTMELLTPLDGENTWAWEISDEGVVVGEATVGDPTGPEHATIWIDGQPIDLHDPALGTQSKGRAVSRGVAVGFVEGGPVHVLSHAFRWTSAGGMELLPELPGADESLPADVNDAGTSVGYCIVPVGKLAVVWHGGGVWYLLDRVVNPDGWTTLLEATGIDGEGRIAGWGSFVFPGGVPHRGFRLVPVQADVDRDRDVDADDVAAFLAACAAGHPAADLDGDGAFGPADLRLFAARFARDARRLDALLPH